MAAPPTLTILIPVYNERATILEVVKRVVVCDSVRLVSRVQIVIVDDDSTDGTEEIVADLGRGWRALVPVDAEVASRITVLALRHERNRGEGAALRTGIEQATGEFLIVQDADLEYDPTDYPQLLRPLFADRADAVYGSRFLPSERRVLLFWHSIGNTLITLAANMATDLNLSDVETGYKAFRTAMLQQLDLESDRFGIEMN